jgi:murein L,D-transpeptidase YafK
LKRLVAASLACITVVYAGVLAAGRAWAAREVPHRACPVDGTLVQVDTAAGVLSLCRSGQEARVFRIAVGRSGVNKRSEGDGKTPLGSYPLRPPRASGRYHVFIPVGYPTPEQSGQGLTGSAIGVHGPHIAFAWLGHATAWPDWTLGCIAVGTRVEIEAIATWVTVERAERINIL